MFRSCWLVARRRPSSAGRFAGLDKIVEQAERNGAIRCAPRELAIARSQLKFASIELDQGFVSKAQAHLAKAEPNARAADFLSPPEYCAKRGFIEPAPGDRDGDGYLDPKDKCRTSRRTTTASKTKMAARTIQTPTATVCPTRSINASSAPRTRTATWTTTAARKPTTTSTACSTPPTSARTIPRTSTATRTTTAVPIPTTTTTPSRT